MDKEIEHPENVDVWGKHSHRGKYTLPSFDIRKVLEMEIPSITVDEIPKDISIEYTPVFRWFLHHFNKAYDINLSAEELLYSRSSFNGFMNFIMMCIIKRYLIISRECENEFMIRIEKLYSTYVENLRSLERYYDEIIRTIFKPFWYSKKDKWVRDEMDHFEQAYTLIKTVFQKDKRESWERTFEHPKGVMEIILRELPNPAGKGEKPSIKKVILALLHDIEETFPEYADVIRKLYGEEMANRVNELSKKDWRFYLTEAEIKVCGKDLEDQKTLFHEVRNHMVKDHTDRAFTSEDKILEHEIVENMNTEQLARYKILEKKIKPFMMKVKIRRDDDYFGHLDQLDDDVLDVKFADRINNLRDNSWVGMKKKLRTIEITKKYFLHIAEKRNPTAYKLMMIEIDKLKASYGD